MVDRVDKPEAPNPYQVQRTAESKRDKPQEQRQPEEQARYQQQKQGQEWEKFQADSGLRKTIRVPVTDIAQMIYRRVVTKLGSSIVDANLVWKDGRTTENISFLLGTWEDFLKIKKCKPGDAIPPNFWAKGKELEITVPQGRAGSGPWSLQQIEEITNSEKYRVSNPRWQRAAQWLGIWDPTTKTVRGSLVVLYSVFILIFIALILSLFGGL